MKNKKDIEQIFQEKLKDFEATPPSESWDYISERLQRKEEKKKIIPIFWWKTATTISGVAALIILGLFLFTDDEKSNTKNHHELASNANKTSESSHINSAEINANEKMSDGGELNHKKEESHELENNIPAASAENIKTKNHNKSIVKTIKQKNTDLAFYKEKTKTHEEVININNKDNIKPENPENKNIALEKIQPNDSLILAKNEDESSDILSKKIEKEIKKVKKENKLSLSPFAAPVLAFSNGGSAIDQKFDNNTNVYKNNISFGVNADYSITDKIKLRSGIHYINLNNNTKNVTFVKTSIASLEDTNALKNVTPNKNLSNIVIANNQFSADLAAFYGISSINEGEIRQELSFIEVPLEISYPIYTKKLKISTVTGFSTYILEKNKVFLMSNNSSSEIGKSSNINNIHYSGNIGFNFQYLLGGKYNLFVEPIFKYQINTYQSQTTNAKPYFIGIYTGFVYQF